MTVANPLLVNNGTKTFASSSSGTLTLYGVQNEEISKNSNLIEFPIPTQDSNKRLVMDLMGSSRNVNITGRVSTNDVSDLYKYVEDLVGLGTNTLVNGNQVGDGAIAGYSYTSEVLNYGRASTQTTFAVYIMDVSVTRDKGDPESFSYSLNLVECDGANSV